MSTYTQILYHIVFSTKRREPVLDKPRRDDFYRFTWGVLRERKSHLYRIGGIEDHVHILCSLHPTIALADLVKEIKTASSSWIKGQNIFPSFRHWQDGYGAFTCSWRERHALIEYIRHQEDHHKAEPYKTEYERLLTEADLVIDERDADW
jgi:putative transposase